MLPRLRIITLLLISLVAYADEPPTNETPPPAIDSRAYVNVTAGMNFVFPTASIAFAPFRNLAVSFSGIYLDFPAELGRLRGRGVLGALNYYSESAFSGIWVMAAGGTNQLNTLVNGEQEDFTTLSAQASVGWRWKGSSPWNLGFGVGFNYLFDIESTRRVGLSGLFPVFIIDLGAAI